MSLFRPERRSVGSLAEVLAAERVRRSGGAHGAVSDVDQALRLGAVWSCMDLICSLVGVAGEAVPPGGWCAGGG
jgi:hypothetical protein